MSEWNMLVKKVFDQNRSKNSAYRLGDAMRDAKKIYRKTAKNAKTLIDMPFAKKRKGRQTRHFKKSRKQRRGRGRRGGNPDDQNQDQNQNQNQNGNETATKGLFSGLF